MQLTGNVWKFGDDIDTDQILPSQYLVLPSIREMVKHAMEPRNLNFSNDFQTGDIIVAGNNFGCGSSREQSPAVLKELGCRVIIAESFARIFFRNSINLGILLVEIADTTSFEDKDVVKVDTDISKIFNETKNIEYDVPPMSDFLNEILQKGGYVNYIKSKGL